MDRLVIVTGMAGSGKTLAADSLEDLGYYCVDNLPASLIPRFCELIRGGREQIERVALVIDAREGRFLDSFPRILQTLREQEMPVQLVFLDCTDDILKRRFSESRRPHPMSEHAATLEDAISRERVELSRLRELADRVIDTTSFTAHQLRSFITNAFSSGGTTRGMRINLVSFGYKHGVPAEADLVFDVRFLPNPHFVDDLRPLDGRNARVRAFLDEHELTGRFVERVDEFLQFLIPLYRAEGKSYLTVAVGCTGGKHRSVAMCEVLAPRVQDTDTPVSVRHRDLGLE